MSYTPDTELFCPTPTHIDAMNVLLFSINSGEVFCKVTGEVGTGKTMLCRLLMKQLENKRTLAYIPNPNLSVIALQLTLATELGLRISKEKRSDQIIQSIQNRLIKISKKNGPVVLIIDEAQVLSDRALEALRLLTNLETEQQKLLQIVLFAQPELNKRLNRKHLRQLKQRISFSYHLKKLDLSHTINYISHRLNAVCVNTPIITPYITGILIHFFSKGTPRLINTLCHKALLLAYSKKQHRISSLNILRASFDTEGVDRFMVRHLKLTLSLILFGISSTAYAFLEVV